MYETSETSSCIMYTEKLFRANTHVEGAATQICYIDD